MKHWHSEQEYHPQDVLIEKAFSLDSLFFDIETTGFSPVTTSLYLIGCAYRKEDFLIIDQFFAEKPEEESMVMESFFTLLASFHKIITFNGIGFDIPYLKAKCKSYQISQSFDSYQYLDIYKVVSKMKFLLHLPSFRQKSIEMFLDIPRDDCYDGGQLIPIYESYVAAPDPETLSFLRLHNYEDVCGMTKLLPILSYTMVLDDSFAITAWELESYTALDGSSNHQELMISLCIKHPIPKRISCNYEDFYLTVEGSRAKLRIKAFQGELKYFFDNYKDYYYLPLEDMAVHKSVAAYVDREFRKNATAATCYTKKQGLFLPQYEELMAPVFREERKSKKMFFEYTAEFSTSTDALTSYVKHIFHLISQQKK